jgi:hypothetical protein
LTQPCDGSDKQPDGVRTQLPPGRWRDLTQPCDALPSARLEAAIELTRHAIAIDHATDYLLANPAALARMVDYLTAHPRVIIFADKGAIVRGLLEAAKVPQ